MNTIKQVGALGVVLAVVFVCAQSTNAIEQSDIPVKSEAHELLLSLATGNICAIAEGPESEDFFRELVANISKELSIYDYRKLPPLDNSPVYVSGKSYAVTSRIDFSQEHPRYIPNQINQGVVNLIEYNNQECAYISGSAVDFYREKLTELSAYRSEITGAQHFLDGITRQINSDSKPTSNSIEVWSGRRQSESNGDQTAMLIRDFKSLGDIEIASPSIFDFGLKSIGGEGRNLIAEVDIVRKRDRSIIDRFIIVYVGDKWMVAMPNI